MGWMKEVSGERLAFIVGSFILVLIILSVTSCTMHANTKSAELLKSGVSALDISCTINQGQSFETACAKVLAVKN